MKKFEQELMFEKLAFTHKFFYVIGLFICYVATAARGTWKVLFAPKISSFAEMYEQNARGIWVGSYAKHLKYKKRARVYSALTFMVLVAATIVTSFVVQTIFPTENIQSAQAKARYQAADSQNYYVNATSGSNANNGSQSAPWQTLSYALTQISGGDTINVTSGTNSTSFTSAVTIDSTIAGAISAPTTIQRWSGQNAPLFDGVAAASGGGVITIAGANYVTIDGFVIRNATSGNAIQFNDANNVTLKNNTIYSNAAAIYGNNNSTNWTVDANNIYSNSGNVQLFNIGSFTNNTLHDNLGGAGSRRQVVIRDADTGTTGSVYINNNTIYSGSDGLMFIATDNNRNFYVKNNTIYDMSVTSISFQFSNSDTGEHIVQNNIVYMPSSGSVYQIFDGTSSSRINANYNNLYITGSANIAGIENELNYATLSSWFAGTAKDVNSISQDPLFTSTTNADFTLQAGSPSVDAGNPDDSYANEPAPNGGRINQGANGNTAAATTSALTDIYVNASAGNNNTGWGSSTAPFATLTKALNYVASGSTIYAAGTFTEQVGITSVHSGTSGSVVTIQAWSDSDAPVIDAADNDHGFSLDNVDYITISGFTVRQAAEDGILVANGSDHATISGVTVRDSGAGAIRFIDSDNGTVENSTIFDNYAGIYAPSGADSFTLAGNVIHDNSTFMGDDYTHGVYVANNDTSAIHHNIIYNHVGIPEEDGAYAHGLALVEAANASVYNNTFYNNSVATLFYSESDVSGTYKNNIIYTGAAGSIGLNISADSLDSFRSNYNNFFAQKNAVVGVYNNSTTPTLAEFQNVIRQDDDSISADPMFASTVSGAEDFHLQENSPSVDTGDPDDDYANEPEPNGGRIDQGAYGNTSEATSASSEDDEVDDAGEEGGSQDEDGDSTTNDAIQDKGEESDQTTKVSALAAENTWVNGVNVADENARFAQVEGAAESTLFAGRMKIVGRKAKKLSRVRVRVKNKGKVIDAQTVRVGVNAGANSWQHKVAKDLLQKGEQYIVQAKEANTTADFTDLAQTIKTNPAPTIVNYTAPVIVVPQTRRLIINGLMQPGLAQAVVTLKNDTKTYQCTQSADAASVTTQSISCTLDENIPLGLYYLGFQTLDEVSQQTLPSVAQKKLLFISAAIDTQAVLNADNRNTLFNSRITTASKFKLVGLGPQNAAVRVNLARLPGNEFYADRLDNFTLLAAGTYTSAIGWQADINLADLAQGKTYLLVVSFYNKDTGEEITNDRILYPIYYSHKVVQPVINIRDGAVYYQNAVVDATATAGRDYELAVTDNSELIVKTTLTALDTDTSTVPGSASFRLVTSSLGKHALKITVTAPHSGLTTIKQLTYTIVAVPVTLSTATPAESTTTIQPTAAQPTAETTKEATPADAVVQEEPQTAPADSTPQPISTTAPAVTVAAYTEIRDTVTNEILETTPIQIDKSTNLKSTKIIGLSEIKLPWKPLKQKIDVVVFSGQAAPHALVTITIRSEPIVKVTRADTEGKWTMTIPVDIIPQGEHTAFLQTEANGVKSEQIEIAQFVVIQDRQLSNTTWMFMINTAFVLVLIIIFVFFQFYHHPQLATSKNALSFLAPRPKNKPSKDKEENKKEEQDQDKPDRPDQQSTLGI